MERRADNREETYRRSGEREGGLTNREQIYENQTNDKSIGLAGTSNGTEG